MLKILMVTMLCILVTIQIIQSKQILKFLIKLWYNSLIRKSAVLQNVLTIQ